MTQTKLGAGVAKFVESIPADYIPTELRQAILRATQGNFGPQDSVVVSQLLGTASSWGSELIRGPRPLNWPQDHGMHMDVAWGWYFLVSNLEVIGEEGVKIAVVTVPMRHTSVSRSTREELGWTPLDAQVVDSNVKMTIVSPDDSVNVLRAVNVQAGIDGRLKLEYRPFQVAVGQDSLRGSQDEPFPLEAHYEGESNAGPVMIDLRHERVDPYFLQGEDGYIPISEKPEKAGFLYYSAAQLKTRGKIYYAGRRFEVAGVSWFDHQWGVGPPEPQSEGAPPALPPRVRSLVPAQAEASYGWVWFAFNFEDGTALTLAAGHAPPPLPEPCELFTFGKLVLPGTAQTIPVEGKVVLTEFMTHEEAQTRWPCGWELGLRKVGSEGPLEMTVKATPWAKDQFSEFASLQQFWEGGVDVVASDLVGRQPGVILTGVGFCESVGFEPADSYVKRALEFLER